MHSFFLFFHKTAEKNKTSRLSSHWITFYNEEPLFSAHFRNNKHTSTFLMQICAFIDEAQIVVRSHSSLFTYIIVYGGIFHRFLVKKLITIGNQLGCDAVSLTLIDVV